MPRISYALLHRARHTNHLLVPLLQVCRDLPSALHELRWLQEHVALGTVHTNRWQQRKLQRLCAARGCGTPLQYLLGNEYFGELNLKVQPGVLIPRRETAAAVSHLAALLGAQLSQLHSYAGRRSENGRVKILDLCTGSGCITLLLRHDLSLCNIHTKSLGVDISLQAVRLGRENERRTTQSPKEISCHFAVADIFDKKISLVLDEADMLNADIIVSNPPYVSPREFQRQTERSVRNFEPRRALVPDSDSDSARDTKLSSSSHGADDQSLIAAKEAHDQQQGDSFYPHLLQLASSMMRPKIFWCEVGGLEQAKRVASMALGSEDPWDGVQIWRDDPGQDNVEHVMIENKSVAIVGRGHGRSVICWRNEGASWLGI